MTLALGRGRGPLWDLACGPGTYADAMRDLGWTPVGTDISFRQLRNAPGWLPVAVADARRAPIRPNVLAAVVSVLCHTDIEDYEAVCRSAATFLAPGGRFVHVGVHPCFCGAFVDRSDSNRLVTTPGYWRRDRRFDAWSSMGVRSRTGAIHLPLGDLVGAIIDAGLTVDALFEFGEPTPDVLSIRAHKPAA